MRIQSAFFLIISFFLIGAASFCAQEKDLHLNKIIQEKDDAKKLELYLFYTDSLANKNFEKSLQLANEGIKIAEKRKNIPIKADLTRLKGNAYYFKGKIDSASFFYYQSLSLLQKVNDIGVSAKLYNNLGRFYRKTKDYKRALKNYDLAFQQFSKINDEEGKATIYNESGVVYEYMGENSEAVHRYQKSLEIQKKRGDLTGQGYALEFIGGNYILQKKYDLAEQYLLQSLEIRKKTDDHLAIALNYNVIGHLYQEQGKLKEAEKEFLKSNELAERLSYLDLMKDNYGQLSKIYRSNNQNDLAYENLEKYKKINDSIFSISKAKQIEELSVKYETVEKDKEILENKNQLYKRNVYLFSLAALFLAGIATAFSIFRHRKKNEKIKIQKEILYQQDLATKAVMNAEDNERKRMATHLHDGVAQLLGAANMNVEALSDFRDDDFAFEKILGKTKTILDDAITDVRSLSHQMMPNMLIKSSLGKAIQDLTEKSNSPKLHIHLTLDGLQDDLDKNIQVVMYRIIQECINNTIKHADAKEVNIKMHQTDSHIFAEFSDDGKGFNPLQMQSKSSGLGLENIRSRIDMLKGSLKISSKEGTGTAIIISIPLQNI